MVGQVELVPQPEPALQGTQTLQFPSTDTSWIYVSPLSIPPSKNVQEFWPTTGFSLMASVVGALGARGVEQLLGIQVVLPGGAAGSGATDRGVAVIPRVREVG